MQKIFNKMLPAGMKKKVLKMIKKEFSSYWNEVESSIPKFELSDSNLANLKVLTTREKMLELLPKNAVVAEIGVDRGDFSKKIFSITAPSKLHLVDLWSSERYPKELKRIVEDLFTIEIKSGQVEINPGLSTAVVENFNDNYFDWIYIDTDHTYFTTIQELIKYSPKVKPGGIIAGHDFITGNWKGMARYGVIEAVFEFCVRYKWELIYLTMENNTAPSFAIRKLD